ncbi:SusC/RagA family TonB-linked outer membrane protein [Pedobacter sp. N36a]|uniref:SusC/RagA family TonB-linked outer membrane protein n=1 Tax=Pedobacter sp. N36a TaxID=2767996 RepID=UPI001656C161|nr:SusC/RagA family TonB-linked outer membrane protein [Pedobacter sp. N36a]MBC8985011.1 SusC/RagA family TonB-linked outer membrane protein [Pedobacter sp. N36a]
MKLTTFLLFAFIMQVSAGTYAQKITLSVKNEELFNVFDKISDQSGYDFIVIYSLLKDAHKVNINVKDAPLKDVLDQIFKEQPLEFSINNKTVLIKKKESSFIDKLIQRFQEIEVKGKVLDQHNLPLPGATVKVKGTKKQVLTNAAGEFTLSHIEDKAVLVISFLGYENKEVLAQENLGSISLTEQTGQLEEVTVSTGYQTLPKERVTGAFSSVSAKQLERQRLSSLSSLLEGRIAGYNNGLIRGTTSMKGVTTPLYVIDGFPVENTKYNTSGSITENVPGLNLEDIESITVLKDAAAASIYGARAANGVIVIVTKKPKKGKPQISASSTFTLSSGALYTDNLTNSADIVDLEREWERNNPKLKATNAAAYAANVLANVGYQSQGIKAILARYAGTLTSSQMEDKLNQLASSGYQYYDDAEKYSKRDPFYQQYNISVGSAAESNSFYSSLTYKNNKFADKYTKDESLGLNLNNTTKINKWLTLELSNYLAYNGGTQQNYNTLSPGYTFLPYDRLRNDDGSKFISTGASRLSANTMSLINSNGLYKVDINPLEEQNKNLGQLKSFSNRSFIKLNAEITPWLTYRSTFQYEFSSDRFNKLYDKNTYYVRNMVNTFATKVANGPVTFNLPYGNINYDQDQFTSAYNFRQQVNIDKTFGEKHNLTAIVGTEIKNAKIEFEDQYLYNYDPNVLTFDLINAKSLALLQGPILGGGNFSNNNIASQRENVNRFVSIYGNAAYAYDNKYLLTGSLRWDRSNLWGTNSKYQNKPLWSVGAGWNIYKESFFNVNWVDLLKLRVSHGIAGNIAKDVAPYMTAYYSNNNNVGGLQGSIGARPNPLLSWEKTTTNNVGLDFSVFRNRISGSMDYYQKQGKDLLASTMGVPTEGFGYSTYAINNGEMTNKGIELSISGDLIRSKDLTWNASILYANNKNKVTYVNVEAPVYYLQLDYPQAYPRIGNPYNAIYSYRWAGLNADGLPQVYNEKGEKVLNSPATLGSIVYSGSTVPTYSGAFNNLLAYKSFSLSFLLTFEGGHKMRNTFLPVLGSAYNGALGGYATQITAVNKDITDRWKTPGDENRTDIPRLVFGEDPAYNSQSAEIYQKADLNVIDASNIRLRNVSLAYHLPKTLVKKAYMENVRFQFNVENAFTIAKSKAAKYLLNGYRPANFVWGVYVNF